MDHHYPALQSQGVHTVQLLQVMGTGEELTTVPCLSRSQRFQVTPLAFSLPPTWHWQLCDKKHCSAVWRSWMISSSRNAQKCCPSYLGEQQLMPCTFLFIPALKSTQEDNRSRQKQCRGCSETCPSHMHSVEMVAKAGHILTFSSSTLRRQRHERVNTHLSQPPANALFPTTFSLPLLSGNTLCYHLPRH